MHFEELIWGEFPKASSVVLLDAIKRLFVLSHLRR